MLHLLLLRFAELQLMDMPECILQHISCFMPARPWAAGPALTCRMLNDLLLPVIKVRSACGMYCLEIGRSCDVLAFWTCIDLNVEQSLRGRSYSPDYTPVDKCPNALFGPSFYLPDFMNMA